MQINPGGLLNIEDVVGRDDEIARYWRVIRWRLVKRWWKERRP